MIFSGRSPRAEIMNILELPVSIHPFYIGTQAHPELTSRPLAPNPMFLGLVHAALKRAYADYDEPLIYACETMTLDAGEDCDPHEADSVCESRRK